MAETTGRYGDNADTRAGDEDARRSGRRHVGVAEAKGTFSAMIEGVQHRGERYVIERHGKPAAALVSLEELDRLESQRPAPQGMTGGLGFIGMWRGILTDEEIDDMVDAIYADRENDVPREVDTSDWGV
ncbi:MAG: type II toxin-antitoxin system Phd/YefM family antitoxin [Chloroflexi bacterium]|nr:type II toxin-antitoxin system Phd/YefM family antitoxin [Chloroflexota bacterium]